MAEAKRSSRINELENELHGLEFLLKQLEQVAEDDIPSFLSVTGYVSKQEIEAAMLKVTQSLRKAKGEPKSEPAETEDKADQGSNEKFPLINVPDNMLTAEQVYTSYTSVRQCGKSSLGSLVCTLLAYIFANTPQLLILFLDSSRKREGSCFLRPRLKAGNELSRNVMKKNWSERGEIRKMK